MERLSRPQRTKYLMIYRNKCNVDLKEAFSKDFFMPHWFPLIQLTKTKMQTYYEVNVWKSKGQQKTLVTFSFCALPAVQVFHSLAGSALVCSIYVISMFINASKLAVVDSEYEKSAKTILKKYNHTTYFNRGYFNFLFTIWSQISQSASCVMRLWRKRNFILYLHTPGNFLRGH